jgi:hypothetical protein
MATFNFGVNCPSEADAENLMAHILDTNLFQDGLDAFEERLSVVSTTEMLEVLKSYAAANSVELSVEVWPEGMELDDAEESEDVEYHDLS